MKRLGGDRLGVIAPLAQAQGFCSPLHGGNGSKRAVRNRRILTIQNVMAGSVGEDLRPISGKILS